MQQKQTTQEQNSLSWTRKRTKWPSANVQKWNQITNFNCWLIQPFQSHSRPGWVPKTDSLGVTGTPFYRPSAFHVTQPKLTYIHRNFLTEQCVPGARSCYSYDDDELATCIQPKLFTNRK